MEDISFISKLDSNQFSVYLEKKAMAMTKLTQATETSEKLHSFNTNFRLTKGSPKITKMGSSTTNINILEKSSSKEKIKERSKEKSVKLHNSTPAVSSSIVPQESVDESYEEDSDEIKFTYTDESCHFPKIKAATIDKLIERLTHEVYPGR